MLKKLFDKLLATKQYAFLKHYTIALYNKFDEDPIWIMASGISFNFLICIIPFTLILFSILGFYLQKDGTTALVDKALAGVVGITPELKTKITATIFRSIDSLSSNSTLTLIIGSIGIIWSASGLFSTIRDALNKIYKIKIEVFYVWAKLKDILMILIIILFFLLSFIATSIFSIIASFGTDFINQYLDIGGLKQILAIVLGLVFSFLMFYLIFTIVPHGRVNKKVAVVSAVSSALMWETLKIFFTYYLIEFANYTVVYGAYAAIVSIIFWIYYSSFVFVLGAEIGQVYKEKQLAGEKLPEKT